MPTPNTPNTPNVFEATGEQDLVILLGRHRTATTETHPAPEGKGRLCRATGTVEAEIVLRIDRHHLALLCRQVTGSPSGYFKCCKGAITFFVKPGTRTRRPA